MGGTVTLDEEMNKEEILESFIIRMSFKVRVQARNSPAELSGPFKSLAFGSGYKMGIWVIDLIVCHDGRKINDCP